MTAAILAVFHVNIHAMEALLWLIAENRRSLVGCYY